MGGNFGAVALLAMGLAVAHPLRAQQAPPKEEAWQLIQPPQSSLIFAADSTLIGEIGKEWRSSVPITTLPPYLPNAFIAVEDQRFRQHNGVDVVGIAGAIKDNLLGDRRGASTITQQLVGNMHPTLVDRSDPSPARKVREQAAALEMERHYTKDQILEAYLNQISFGHGWFGVEAASRHYFGKSASRVTLAEAATLAAIPKGPAIYDPIAAPARARERRNLVLDLMAQQKYITREAAAAAKREPLVTALNAGMSVRAPYVVDAVRQEADRLGLSLANGGYQVFTTIDPALQTAAIDALRDGLADLEGPARPTAGRAPASQVRPDQIEGAVVALDPANGAIRALVGGRDFQTAPFNRALNAIRQPGSAFKPFVYATAIADSLPASTLVADTAISIRLDDGRIYQPKNADGEFLGPMLMRDGLAKSRNAVAVQLAESLGIGRVIALAQSLGIQTPIAPYPSSAIGASVLRPIELVAAYAAFDNLGARVDPRVISQVTDVTGHPVWSAMPAAPSLVLDPRVAFIVRNMMEDVVRVGTGTSVRRYLPPDIPVAGKTGTTDDNTDAWFVGMTPELVAGVWVGYDTPKPIGIGGTGASLAAPIWGRMMGDYYRGRDVEDWSPPAGLVTAELDRATGQLANDSTPPDRRYTEFFLEGTEPLAIRPNPWLGVEWRPAVTPW